MKNYYQILAVDSKANPTEIRRAYHSLAKKYHPDMNNQSQFSVQHFQEIQEAYSILSNSTKKQLYDYQWNIYQNPLISTTQNFANQSVSDEQKYHQQKVYEKYKEELKKIERKLNRRATIVALLIVTSIIFGGLLLSKILTKELFGFIYVSLFVFLSLGAFIWRIITDFNNYRNSKSA